MDTLLKVPQIAEYLGVSDWTIYQWVAKDFIPYHRLPAQKRGGIRFRKSEIDLWVETLAEGFVLSKSLKIRTRSKADR
jgi:excisionase family DNA binding protein